jgi:hypothetical protein
VLHQRDAERQLGCDAEIGVRDDRRRFVHADIARHDRQQCRQIQRRQDEHRAGEWQRDAECTLHAENGQQLRELLGEREGERAPAARRRSERRERLGHCAQGASRALG